LGAIGSGIITSALEDEEEEGGETAEPTAAGGRGNALRLTADPSGELRFDRHTLRARPGEVTIVMENPSTAPHNVSIEGRGSMRRAIRSGRVAGPPSAPSSGRANTTSTARSPDTAKAAWRAR
jgi:hypothetical protein